MDTIKKYIYLKDNDNAFKKASLFFFSQLIKGNLKLRIFLFNKDNYIFLTYKSCTFRAKVKLNLLINVINRYTQVQLYLH